MHVYRGGEGGDVYGQAANSPIGQQPALSGQLRSSMNSGLMQPPDPNCAVEYKKGYVMRKSCVEPEGRKSKDNS